ncbi:MAG: SHD1 domain-containing protein [Planctomycetota bacterium]|nr:SHD1 domain-containing protein [Planctomycetota bacterium]
MFRHRPVCLCLVFVATVCGATAFARTWTDSTGKHKIEGEFVKLAEGQVDIRGDNGTLIRIPLEKLSEENQQYVRQAAKPAMEETQFAVPAEDEKPVAKAPASGDPKDTQTVVAEGVGISKEESLKDAFRAAVRQVVGEVADSETLVKNDELVKDQVLTYSDGFIPKHEEVSIKREGGLFRTTIVAQVERRSVIAKLESARITMRRVDGKGMFSSVVTELDAEKNAANLVEKVLEGFPLSCLEVQVVGEPRILSKANNDATIAITVDYHADIKAFDTFAARLHDLLKHVAKKHGSFSVAASRDRSSGVLLIGEDDKKLSIWSRHIPSLDELAQRRDSAALAVNMQRTKKADRTEWNYYLLDSSTRAAFASRAACVFTTKLSFLDKSGGLIATESFPACIPRTEPNDKSLRSYSSYHVSLIFSGTESGDSSYGAYDGFYYGYPAKDKLGFYPEYFSLLAGGRNQSGTGRNRGEVLFVIAPLFFDNCPHTRGVDYVPSLSITRTVTLQVDELRDIHTVRAELRFEGILPKLQQETE